MLIQDLEPSSCLNTGMWQDSESCHLDRSGSPALHPGPRQLLNFWTLWAHADPSGQDTPFPPYVGSD